MKLFASAVFGLIAAVASVAQGEEAVHHLGDSDFDAHVEAHKYVLVELYAPWCGHCKALKEPYEEAAKAIKELDIEGGVSLVAVDATEHKELATRFGVQGFPTLKWMVNGKESDYGGGRTKDDIVAWVTKKTGPPAKTLEDEAGLTAFKESATVTVVGSFDSVDSDAAKAFIAAAETDDTTSYGITTVDAVRTATGLEGEGVIIFRDFQDPDPKEVVCPGELTEESIKKCVAGNSLPLLIPFSQDNAPKIFGGAIKQHVLLFMEDKATPGDVHAAANPVAKKNTGDYLFVTVDKSDDRIFEFFGITEADLPTARIVEMGEGAMKKFALEGAPTEESLDNFITSHASGSLSPDLKSEEPLADSEQEDVWVLVGKDHDKVAFGDKNVLVEYYAPWCGHCKQLAPVYEKVGTHYKDDDTVLIAKMDATANEAESVSVQGFPTLKFFKAGSDTPIDFEGERDFDGITGFIDKNKA